MVTPGFQALDMTSYLFRPPCLEDEPSNELALAITHSRQVRPVHLSRSLAALNEADSIASVLTTLPLRQTPQGRLLKLVVKKDGKGSITRPRCPCQEGRAQKGDQVWLGGIDLGLMLCLWMGRRRCAIRMIFIERDPGFDQEPVELMEEGIKKMTAR